MPDTGTLVTMVAHTVNVSTGTYLTTRTRRQFERDAKATMSGKLLPVEVVLGVVASALGADTGKRPPPVSERLDLPSKKLSDAEHEQEYRERKSRQMYGWYRRVSGRSYSVHNLDTRNPAEFKGITKKIGLVLSTRSKQS